MLILTLFVACLLCLVFDSTRMIGIIGLMLMLYLYPPILVLLPIAGAFYVYNHYK